jgi:hypothetical protein
VNIILAVLPSAFSLLAAIFAAFAHRKASQAAKTAELSNPYLPPTVIAARRLGPNDAAGPSDVANKIDGVNGATGQAEPFRLAAMLYDAHLLGLGKDYAFPEGSNVSASMADQVTTLAKLLTRKKKMVDGNDYDLWDACMTAAKAAIIANQHVNDDEVNSVNYKKPASS